MLAQRMIGALLVAMAVLGVPAAVATPATASGTVRAAMHARDDGTVVVLTRAGGDFVVVDEHANEVMRSSALAAALAAAETRMAAQETQIAALTAALADAAANLTRALEALDVRVDEVAQVASAANVSAAAVTARMEAAETRMDGVDTRMDGVDTRVDTAESRIGTAESRIDGVDGELVVARSNMSRAQADIRSLEQSTAATASDVAAVRTESERINSSLSLVSVRVERLAANASATTAAIASVTRDVAAVGVTVSGVQSNVTRLGTSVSQLTESAALTTTTVTGVQSNVTRVAGAVTAVNATVVSLQATSVQHSASLAALNANASTAAQANARLAQQVVAANVSIAGVQGALASESAWLRANLSGVAANAQSVSTVAGTAFKFSTCGPGCAANRMQPVTMESGEAVTQAGAVVSLNAAGRGVLGVRRSEVYASSGAYYTSVTALSATHIVMSCQGTSGNMYAQVVRAALVNGRTVTMGDILQTNSFTLTSNVFRVTDTRFVNFYSSQSPPRPNFMRYCEVNTGLPNLPITCGPEVNANANDRPFGFGCALSTTRVALFHPSSWGDMYMVFATLPDAVSGTVTISTGMGFAISMAKSVHKAVAFSDSVVIVGTGRSDTTSVTVIRAGASGNPENVVSVTMQSGTLYGSSMCMLAGSGNGRGIMAVSDFYFLYVHGFTYDGATTLTVRQNSHSEYVAGRIFDSMDCVAVSATRILFVATYNGDASRAFTADWEPSTAIRRSALVSLDRNGDRAYVISVALLGANSFVHTCGQGGARIAAVPLFGPGSEPEKFLAAQPLGLAGYAGQSTHVVADGAVSISGLVYPAGSIMFAAGPNGQLSTGSGVVRVGAVGSDGRMVLDALAN
jgi:predicted  nucleic acid-binding Zn-ribbon protein